MYLAAHVKQSHVGIFLRESKVEEPKPGVRTISSLLRTSCSLHSYQSVWNYDEPTAEPSQVGMGTSTEWKPEWRSSKTCKETFFVWNNLYSESNWIYGMFQHRQVEIGDGRKHIYDKGDFMKPHYDSTLPPRGQLPHTMTMLVTDDISPVRICGQPVQVTIGNHLPPTSDSIWIVFFTLDCPHEVVPVNCPRISFTFPVFGKYKGIAPQIPESYNVRNVYELLLEKIDETDPENEDEVNELAGWIKLLRDDDFLRDVAVIQAYNGETIRDHDGYPVIRDLSDYKDQSTRVYIRYTDESGTRKEHVLDADEDSFQVPEGSSDVNVFYSSPQTAAMAALRDQIEDMIQVVEPVCITHDPIRDDVEVPSYAFLCRLQGRYQQFDTAEQLQPADRQLYDFLQRKGYRVAFYPLAKDLQHFYVSEFKDKDSAIPLLEWIWNDQRFAPLNENDLEHVTDAEIVFDDSASYDIAFTRVFAMLAVWSECSKPTDASV